MKADVLVLEMANGFRKLTNQLKQEEQKANVHRLQNQDVQVEAKALAKTFKKMAKKRKAA